MESKQACIAHDTAQTNADPQIKGIILLELAVCLPIILMIIAGAIEYSRVIKMRQTIGIISRNVASTAQRQCANQVGPTAPTPNLSTCLDIPLTAHMPAVLVLPPGTIGVSVKIYRANNFVPTGVPSHGVVASPVTSMTLVGIRTLNYSSSPGDQMVSNYPLRAVGDTGPSPFNTATLGPNRRFLSVAEVSYRYTLPFFEFSNAIGIFKPKDIREVTIF